MRVQRQEIILDNELFVPHNKLLCKTVKAHINVENCVSVKAIKYIRTIYVNKCSEMATFAIGDERERDEVNLYNTGRFISSNEAIWRIFEFVIHLTPVISKSINLLV